MSDKKNFLKKRLHKDSVVNQVVEQITDSIIAGNLHKCTLNNYVKVFLELTVNKSLIVICVRAFSKCFFFEYFFLLAQFLKEGA